jgi:hypothetical protein
MQSLGGEGANINPEIERVSRPIASVFGLPPAIVGAAKKSVFKKETDLTKDGEEGESKKDLFAKLTEGFGKLLEKLGEGINNNPPPSLGITGPGTGSDSAGENLAAFISTLEATGEQNQADVMQVMVNRAKGDSDKLFHEVTGKAQFTPASSAIYGATGHDPAADAAYGHIAPLLGNTPEERKAKLREIAAGPNGINNLRELFKTGDAAAAAKVLADFKTGGPLSAKSRADVGGGIYFKGYTPESGGVYLDRGAGANKFHTLNGSGGKGGTTYQLAQSVPTPPTTAPPQLGQAITNNYGLKVGQERTFNHPEYGEIKAHKTATGFEFFGSGFNNKLDLSKPQGKAIVDYFTSTNGGQTITPQISPPPSARQQTDQQVGSLSPPPKSSGGGITVLNTGGGQQIASAGSSPQPSGDGGVESGRNPTQDFFSNPFSLGVG